MAWRRPVELGLGARELAVDLREQHRRSLGRQSSQSHALFVGTRGRLVHRHRLEGAAGGNDGLGGAQARLGLGQPVGLGFEGGQLVGGGDQRGQLGGDLGDAFGRGVVLLAHGLAVGHQGVVLAAHVFQLLQRRLGLLQRGRGGGGRRRLRLGVGLAGAGGRAASAASVRSRSRSGSRSRVRS